MDRTESSAGSAHAPPTREARTCPECEGTGFVVIDRRYVPTTGILTFIEGPCSGCRATGEVSVYLYGVGA